jgi:hypothetical protein
MTTHGEMVELVELYALNALEGAELVDFEAHLETCELCQSQVAEALTVTASFVADAPAPTQVWDRIVADIDPPVATVTELPRRRGPFFALTTIAAALAIALGGVLIGQNSLTAEETLTAAAERAADEPGSTVAQFVVDDVTVGEVVLGSDGVGFVLPTDALVDLEDTRTYQLWVINDEGRVISGGVLGHSPTVSTFTWTDGVSGFALTREVAGGVEVSEGDVVAAVTDL